MNRKERAAFDEIFASQRRKSRIFRAARELATATFRFRNGHDYETPQADMELQLFFMDVFEVMTKTRVRWLRVRDRKVVPQ